MKTKVLVKWTEKKFITLNTKYVRDNISKALKVLKRGEEVPDNITPEMVMKIIRLAEKLVDRTYFALALDEAEGVRAAELYFTMKEMRKRGQPIDKIELPNHIKKIDDKVQEQFKVATKIMKCPECGEILAEGRDVNGHCYNCPSCGSEACNVSGLEQQELLEG